VSVREGYARWAREYDDYPNPLVMAEEPIVRSLLADARGKHVVDVATGTGRHAQWLGELGARVTALDSSAAMLALAREKTRGLRVAYALGDLAALPLSDASCDIVLNALVMEHVTDIGPAIRETARVLVRGGALVLSVFHPAFVLKGVPAHFASSDGREYELPTYVHLASEYARELVASGMEPTDFVEPRVDDALVARRPSMRTHHGLPIAIVLRARKR